ncbi:N-lysine methyltransferase KMT5A-like [Festucalex cinctus]
MSVMRPQRAKVKPKEEAAYFSSLGKDKDGFTIKYIDSFKGRGVFSSCYFQKGDFLVEYRGDIISKQERENRLRVYHDALKVFMFEFRYNGKTLCVDAARDDNSLGRLVNDDHICPNSKMQRITVDRQPHLCLFATKDIEPGEEITYNYGDFDFPWRLKVSTEAQPHDDTAVRLCQSLPDFNRTT